MKNIKGYGRFAFHYAAALLLSHSVCAQSPWIVSPPASQAVPEGGNAVLNVSVTGALPITYTWHRNYDFWTPYYEVTLNSTNCTLILTNLTPNDAGFFSLDTHNAEGYSQGAQAIIAVISSGMETNGFALTIRGLTNSVWTINCATNMGGNWFTLTNFGIPAYPPVFKFVDMEATNLNRFYQVIPKVY